MISGNLFISKQKALIVRIMAAATASLHAANILDIENTPMFCFQCEQTAKGEGCTVRGVCQK